ncbi:MAG: cyclic nucleotide-binding domain-containing protein [Chloroflexi bacterium]|nr:cyclic nucleotide-binding domain-containing protein [Chloroflexota bacterium]
MTATLGHSEPATTIANDRAAELPPTPLFGGLSQEDWPELLKNAVRIELDLGGIVFLQGEESDAFYVVVAGSVEVREKEEGRDQQILAHLGAGAVLGESSLFLGGLHSASVYASEPTTLLRFPREAFTNLLWQREPGAIRVAYNMGFALAVRLRAADAQIADLSRGRAQTGAGQILGVDHHGKVGFVPEGARPFAAPTHN